MAGANQASPHGTERGEQHSGASDRWELRLAISIPALLVLFILAYGLVSYRLFSSNWDDLVSGGAGDVAKTILEGHLYAMILFSIVGMGVGMALAFTILKPIRAINETAQLIAQGKFNQRAPDVKAASELGDLSRSFNSMIEFLNESIQERNRYLLEGIMSGLLTATLDGEVTALNSTGSKILGLERADVVGQNLSELLSESRAEHRPLWNYLQQALRHDKTQMPDELVLKSGEGEIALLAATSVLRDAEGVPRGVMVNFRDAGQIRRLNEQLSKTDQLAALGMFTMGLAHELRNPLGAIKGLIQLLDLQKTPAEQIPEYLGRIVREVDRLDKLVQGLLDFSNSSPMAPESLDLNETLAVSLHAAREKSDPQRVAEIQIDEDLTDIPSIIAQPDRLVQAFANIISNAIEAARPGSRITLHTRRRAEPEGEFVTVRIHNTGSTIAHEDKTRIFDPFFSTKDKGSGLGLAIVYQIIAQNNGTIDLSVGPDDVTFIIRFRAEPGAAVAPSEEIGHQCEQVA